MTYSLELDVEYILEIMKEKGLSKSDLARAIPVTRQRLNKIFISRAITQAAAIAAALKIRDPRELIAVLESK